MARSAALVFGGSGTVGREVVRGLARARVPTVFTWHRGEAAARALADEVGARAVRLDLGSADAIRQLLDGLATDGFTPDVFVHCAAVGRSATLAEITDEDWRAAEAVNCHAPFVAAQWLGPRMARAGEGHIVLVGALDRLQSIALPVHFAATQGMLSAMTMALAKELGPGGVRVNLVALGLLEEGLGRALRPTLHADYKSFSALRRVGTATEAARAVLWLALENGYMSGKTLSVNGGI